MELSRSRSGGALSEASSGNRRGTGLERSRSTSFGQQAAPLPHARAPAQESVKVYLRARAEHAEIALSDNEVRMDGFRFPFDAVLGPSASQQEVFETVAQAEREHSLVDFVCRGFNASVIAYGSSGTGKTFSLFGTDDDRVLELGTRQLEGLCPRMVRALFERIEMDCRDPAVEYSVHVSMLEVYNERLYDLLVTEEEEAVREALRRKKKTRRADEQLSPAEKNSENCEILFLH